MIRRKAYSWLAGKLGMPVEQVHIGEFDEALCMQVVQACKMANVEMSGGVAVRWNDGLGVYP